MGRVDGLNAAVPWRSSNDQPSFGDMVATYLHWSGGWGSSSYRGPVSSSLELTHQPRLTTLIRLNLLMNPQSHFQSPTVPNGGLFGMVCA
jgi:hypothetical protein